MHPNCLHVNATRLYKSSFLPWITAFDFSVVFNKSEKWGGKEFSIANAKACLVFIKESIHMDLGVIGSFFPWTNKR